MTPEELKNRTKTFALRVIRLVDALPKNRTAEIVGRQLLRCGTSVGANYRSACRSRTNKDFLSRMGIVEEEADEAGYWLEVIEEAGLMAPEKLISLKQEADELVRIIVASIQTARRSGTETIRNPKSRIRNQN